MDKVQNIKGRIPKVSIGMPVYNGEKYIREALDSLLGQTFTDFELIISNNGSTDGTEAICREYVGHDQRIRYVRQGENRGGLFNFQFVLDEAVGEYFMWAAHDDRRSERFLEYAVAVLDQDHEAGLVFSDMYVEDLLTRKKEYRSIGFIGNVSRERKYIFRLLHSCPSCFYGLHRRLILRKLKMECYDYLDIHLTHWYEINSCLKTIPLPLYTAGTVGIRIPRGVTGKYINAKGFLKAEWKLLRSRFAFFRSLFLFLFVVFVYQRNTIRLNEVIRKAR